MPPPEFTITDTLFPETADLLFVNCHLATMVNGSLSIVENAALAVTGKKISWIGYQKNLPDSPERLASQIIDCRHKWILPGFVDCHTHLVWAGSRSTEFEMRLKGIGYEDIIRNGGGIFSTVRATRDATQEALFSQAAKRMATFLTQGITCVEIKSGYGLDMDTELKILSTIDRLTQNFPQHIEPTFLGAHALPPEYKNRPDAYVDLVTRTMLPRVKDQGIATAVDVFCEHIAFSRAQTQKIFEAATALGFRVKLHAEQLSDMDGAALAAEFNALSCDHIEYLSAEGAKKMAQKQVSAVLLPGAFYFLRETQKPPIQLLRKLKIPMAISTDLNPGTSPVHAMTLILNMACLLFGLTCEEALAGATLNGARALGLDTKKGSLEVGKDADLVVFDINSPADLCYLMGTSPVAMVVISGKTEYTCAP
ncbi:MAG: imidazolonepropionase [Proteobacteria bacterium]|nr:imidazolonepropionase [Desulfobacula sp.]MBU3954150.1 imidazolonepropionase [Pseudomonadota bacterium]MBU4131771.1 imidazolonepropionase [Pseudomonadota bacterium]